VLDAALLRYWGGYVLLGRPRQSHAYFSRVYFYVDASSFHGWRVIIVDRQGHRTRFDFQRPFATSRVPRGEFSFEPPPGTQLFRAGDRYDRKTPRLGSSEPPT
jgi:hypothetical protein